MNVGGIADPALEERNSPESGGQLCSAPRQLIAMRRGGFSMRELDQSPFHCLGHVLGLTHWVKRSLFILCKGEFLKSKETSCTMVGECAFM